MIATRRIRPRSHDPIPLETLTRGTAVSQDNRVGIVAAVAGGRVLLWPVWWRAGERVAEVPVTDWTDSLVLGSPTAAMVQADVLRDVPHAGLRRLGRIGAGLLTRIEHAAARDFETGKVISRWQGDRGHRRNAQPARVAL